ncbi:MAG: hypothetical protein A2W22_03135 [Candidatus Levybacteria bacterium RBG_16_35_11]|nr:MAG: hypothetical protein A2W22_03135 [Candidatus Levybacteria bacterium RBG_16_35_11]
MDIPVQKRNTEMSKFTPSRYQSAVFDWFRTATSNMEYFDAPQIRHSLIIEAVAGSGKTTTGIEALKYIPKALEGIYVAFNKHIATELQSRLPENIQAKTYHALGLSICKDNIGRKLQLNADKIEVILKGNYRYKTQRWLFSPVKRIISLLKANLLDATGENILELAFYHNIELSNDYKNFSDDVIECVQYAMRESCSWQEMIDFEDMCYFPVHFKMNAHKFDFLFVDELQDTNKVQMELALMSVNEHGCIVGCGDRYQSIYAFRGADSSAIPNMIERLQADTLPLSITYRNPKSIVELVKSKFPYINIEHADWAQDGIIDSIKDEVALDMYKPEDMILCRTNAPLIEPCFALIRKGIKAQVKGRDIGQGLTALIKKMKASDVSDLIDKLVEYRGVESERLAKQEKFSLITVMEDKVDTIFALTEDVQTVEDLFAKITAIFADEIEGVTFSSIHKAKGLEAKRVFILRPDLMPHPMAMKSKQEWAAQQERNIEYVAITRSLSELHYVMQ